ncbi:hypothetical protein amb1728 [Paramagnetospirillum magneticum AMB-1]|uniref:Lipoprotein n=1 Tax=Paramagnetospirillum magneticum (strain ATCC 700264 / AMB-1) TaxID=342108 RepID=Q2W6J3_PARM1|nr:hypothetical protein amb1728 [Paramagnetospirillum magneticum AMB-1]
MKRSAIIFVAVAALVASCATQITWYKEGATIEDYNLQAYNCEKDMRQSGYFGDAFAAPGNMRSFYSKCMIVHGWYPREWLITCRQKDGALLERASQVHCASIGGTPVIGQNGTAIGN